MDYHPEKDDTRTDIPRISLVLMLPRWRTRRMALRSLGQRHMAPVEPVLMVMPPYRVYVVPPWASLPIIGLLGGLGGGLLALWGAWCLVWHVWRWLS